MFSCPEIPKKILIYESQGDDGIISIKFDPFYQHKFNESTNTSPFLILSSGPPRTLALNLFFPFKHKMKNDVSQHICTDIHLLLIKCVSSGSGFTGLCIR